MLRKCLRFKVVQLAALFSLGLCIPHRQVQAQQSPAPRGPAVFPFSTRPEDFPGTLTRLTEVQINSVCSSNRGAKGGCTFSTTGTKGGVPVQMNKARQKLLIRQVEQGRGTYENGVFYFTKYNDMTSKWEKLKQKKLKQSQKQPKQK